MRQPRFIDLFCGIGGMRLAFEANRCKCVFSCDWDKYARQTYEANFGEAPSGDIRRVIRTDIPSYDILVAGFPCQPFSISGVSKKNAIGTPHAFADRTQGTLFFELARLIEEIRPSAFLLENVKNLLNHDKGRTIQVIYETLRDDLGYHVYPPFLFDAQVVVPQHRERVFMVGFREPREFRKPELPTLSPKLIDILEDNPSEKYTLTAHLWAYLRQYAEKHKAAGNGFGFGMADLNGWTRTLSARYYKDGSEILIPQGRGRPPRRVKLDRVA